VIFNQLDIPGAYLVLPERHEDERGFFSRTWCNREFNERGLNSTPVQCNISFNKVKATLRGMHYQAPPHEEAKLVRCTAGAILDVVVDLRRDSPTFLQHSSATLTAGNRHSLYVPEGCAHGFMTLEDSTEVFYQMTEFYAPGAARGVRWDDPAFQIPWPMTPAVISERDRTYPNIEL
jgi:dTDP-4-dehydrorhamnose 3,5-epimerase